MTPMLIFLEPTLVIADVDFSFFSAYFLIGVFSAESCRELLVQEYMYAFRFFSKKTWNNLGIFFKLLQA
jgi:hypothetical protein